MIRIKPEIEYRGRCPLCARELAAEELLWQGIHVCVRARCGTCGAEIVEDLPVGHASAAPWQVDLQAERLHGAGNSRPWFGEPLLASLRAPQSDAAVGFEVEEFRQVQEVVILNCLDYLYGHALLKLLNADAILREWPERGLIVIVPRLLRWLVPDGVAEVWTVDVPLSKAQHYYPQLDRAIAGECQRFASIWLSTAHCHPADFDIGNFSGIDRHDFSAPEWRITFVWREDRPWVQGRLAVKVARRAGLLGVLCRWQNHKVRRLFRALRARFPAARFTVTGLGVSTRFPAWIEDRRVARFTDEEERQTCLIYAQSRLVIGVHGSNMLLPSAHAGITIDLMPRDRWGNFAQDILYQESDSRVASFRYRYLPLGVPLAELTHIVGVLLEGQEVFRGRMRGDSSSDDRPQRRT